MMRSDLYLSGIAASRSLYRMLFEEASTLLGPAETHPESQDLISHASVNDLAKKLRLSPTTVYGDLKRLVNFKWVDDAPPPNDPRDMYRTRRRLGCRKAGKYFLLADVEAEARTGALHLVSEVVLGLNKPEAIPPFQPTLPIVTPAPVSAPTLGAGRGTNRRWKGA